MPGNQLEFIRKAEERLVNVWPAPSTLLMDGWVVRFANGYSGRANSASPIHPDAILTIDLIEVIEQLYREATLSPTVRITPLAHGSAEPMLLKRGYHVKDEAAMMMLDLSKTTEPLADPRVLIEGRPYENWLQGISMRQEASKSSSVHLNAIVGQLRVPAAFATLAVEGERIGFGMGALDRGWAEFGSIMLDQQHRGKGLGKVLVESLVGWAKKKGAERAFLQVDVTNSVAVKLYKSLGFEELCRYRTLVLK